MLVPRLLGRGTPMGEPRGRAYAPGRECGDNGRNQGREQQAWRARAARHHAERGDQPRRPDQRAKAHTPAAASNDGSIRGPSTSLIATLADSVQCAGGAEVGPRRSVRWAISSHAASHT
jgi:hypothetical protein